MIKSQAAFRYRERVEVVKKNNDPKAILSLFNDAGLRALDKKLRDNCLAVNSMSAEDFLDPIKFAAYKAAYKAFSQNPRTSLIVLFQELPLTKQYDLAKKNREMEKLFVENLNDKDKESLRSPKPANVNGKKADGCLPHPLITILKRSIKGGGPLGEIKLANELNQYCADQLSAFYKNPLNFGMVNAVGVLLTLFKPRKVDVLLEIASQFRGKKQLYPFVTSGDVRNFFRKPLIVKHLKRLRAIK